MKHVLPTETVNKILNYLAGKPYAEVCNLIEEVKQKAEAVLEKAEQALKEDQK